MAKQKIIIAIVSMALLAAPLFAEARGLVPCGGYKADGSREAACTVVDVFYLGARLTNWLISMGGIYAVFKIIQHSLSLVISRGNEEAIKTGREGVTDAVVGFVLVLTAYVIVNTTVNSLLLSKCTIDLRDPLTYLSVQSNYNDCQNPKK